MFAGEVKKMQAEKMKPQEQLTLEPYERDHAVVVGVYRFVISLFTSNNRPFSYFTRGCGLALVVMYERK